MKTRVPRDQPTRQNLFLFLLVSLLFFWIIAEHKFTNSKFLLALTNLPTYTNPANDIVFHNAINSSEASGNSDRTISNDCLVHTSLNVSAGWKIDGGILEQETATCGKLRRKWEHNPPESPLAKQMANHQSDCSKPIATHYLDNTYGLGSHLILWGQAMCNAMEQGYRLHSSIKVDSEYKQWIWLDQEYCATQDEHPMTCYFPWAEEEACALANQDSTGNIKFSYNFTNVTVQDPRAYRCALTQKTVGITERDEYRASATEYLFSHVSPLVIQEAQRQIGIIFGDLPNAMAPENLITVHIRWGDKFWEMDLAKIEEYIDAIQSLIQSDASLVGPDGLVHIYLATEDPKAHDEFLAAVPNDWKVYADITLQEINSFRPVKGNRASHATRNTKGRAGLVAMGSLLVALEAKAYVLTTKSNFSSLINHLRRKIVNRQCRKSEGRINDDDNGDECTAAIDLRPDVW
ncbi:unnamed protein product [Cylindrotheca closterium]|uniref:Uncharacterized protein n=1 Tax=Cylindrotheca closterium TaxID=2856 RepID=A0AAD2CHB1_9STRA|nr:unnamed protein product [Cylindrotheca closterium]